MKSRHFILAALVALVTFAGLRVAARHRRWAGQSPWNHGGPRRFFSRRCWPCADEATPGFGAGRPAVPIGPVPPPSQPLAAPTDSATPPRQ